MIFAILAIGLIVLADQFAPIVEFIGAWAVIGIAAVVWVIAVRSLCEVMVQSTSQQ